MTRQAADHVDDNAVELRVATPSAGLADVAAVADFALGAALRRRLGAGQGLPTVTLTLELAEGSALAGTWVRAWGGSVSEGLVRAHGLVLDPTGPVGHCCATFAVPPHATGLKLLPWEVGADRDVGEPTAVGPADGLSTEDLVAAASSVAGSTTTLRPVDSMLNRGGSVQGAVLFRLAAGFPRVPTRLVSGHVQFLHPADARSPVTATPTVLAETRRTLFVHSLLRQQGRVVAAGSFVLRKDEAPDPLAAPAGDTGGAT